MHNMDAVNGFLSPEAQAVILQVLAVLAVAMPLLEKLVAHTATKRDDQALDWLKKLLALVPRVGFGGKK
jgi:hypothetical protein